MAPTNPSGVPASFESPSGTGPNLWNGPSGERPDLPLPPRRQPLLHRGLMRKRWRYVGYYGDEVMLCAAVVLIGVFRHTFWSIWDRSAGAGGRVFEHTRLRPGRPEVLLEGPRLEVDSGQVTASLVFGDVEPVEVVCPSGRGWGWTRKRAGVPVRGRISVGDRVFEIDGEGVDDESAGFHARHTAWFWSAGVGRSTDGRRLAWNLVDGINDPVTGSERAIWVDGIPREPGPVRFEGLESLGSLEPALRTTLDFHFEGAERCRHDNFGLIRSDYVHRFGSFTGQLDGIEIASASGVMEHHKAVW